MDTGNPVASDAAAAAPDDLLQQALGAAYVLEAEIGRGGMARVYRAHDRKHDRPVALKVLHPDVAQTLGSERFRREIRLAARLQHPHIVPVFDSGDAAGRLWFTMPLVSGESLRDRLAQARQLAVDDAVRLAREVALALEYAHGQGVVHRDVKPENILLTADGQTLLGDFGIARRSGAEGEAAGGGMTGTGFSVGTPAYMSPEQGAGDPHVDGRSDQYALACVLYECLAGEPPFTGPTPQAVLAKRFASPAPDVSVLRDGVAPGVRAALARALARSPADRFPTTAAFAAALADAHAPHPPGPTQATAASPRRRRRVGAVALGIAALAAGAAAVFAWRTAERASVAPLAATSVPVASKQLTFSGAAEDPALSPDGRQVAYVETRCASEAGRACVTELRVQDVASGQSGALTSAEVVLSPQWSPDGAWLLTLMLQTDGEPGMYLTPRLGGSTRRVAPVGVTAFSVTGDTILFVGQAAPGAAAFLQRIRAATGAALDSMPLPPSISRPTAIVPSPDGRRLAVRVGERLMLATPDGRVTDSLPFRFRGTLRWDPRGDALYAFKPGVGINDWLLRARVDGARGRFAGGVDTVLSLATVNTGTFDITRDGRTLVHTGGTTTSTLWAVDLDARPATPRRLAASTSWLDVPYLSSDGQLIAYGATDQAGDNVYVMPFAGGPGQPLTRDSGQLASRGWVPGARRLTYSSASAPGSPLYVQDVPQGARRVLGRDGALPLRDGGIVEQAASPRRLVFRGGAGPERAVAIPDSLGSFVSLWAADPDGSGAYVRAILGATARHRVSRVDRATGAITAVVDLPIAQAPFALGVRDGAVVYATWLPSGDSGHPTVWSVAPGRPPVRVAELPLRCDRWTLTMSADGRRFACAESARRPDVFLLERFDRYRR